MESAHLDVAKPFGIGEVVRASRGARLVLDKGDHDRLDERRATMIGSLIDEPRRVYGFNTGFGDNRNRPTIPVEKLGVIQDNLILSHATGFGEPLEEPVVRAALAIRAHSLALGYSGVRGALVSALCDLANGGELPPVPRFGSVGASGDLAPLSHLCLPLLKGRSKLSYRPSNEFPGALGPESSLGPKEGLALNNGTAFMAAHLALACAELENVLWHADLALALNIEAMCGVVDALSPQVQALRRHAGANRSSERVLGFLKGSRLVIDRGNAPEAAREARTSDGVLDSTQDDYCLRCGPVVHGTASDALESAKSTVETELNSVTDNPLVFGGDVLSGAHFHGMPLAFAADQLRTAMALVAGISERRVAKVLNDKRNYGLPRHLVLDDPHGVKSGWMIAQYCAASMVNELRTRAHPYCVGNVTTGNESEDFVSMGANACRAAYECVSVLRGVVAIELAVAVRALLLRVGGVNDPSSPMPSASPTANRVLGAFVDAGIQVWHTDDRPLEPLIAACADLVRTGELIG